MRRNRRCRANSQNTNTESRALNIMQRQRVFPFVLIAVTTGTRYRTKSSGDRQLQTLSIPKPKFQFGDLVACDWVNDDDLSEDFGANYHYEGIIMGMVWSPKGWNIKGWVYHVKWVKDRSCQLNIVGQIEETHESELKRVAVKRKSGSP
jgi:hypothetical protein